MDVEQVFTSRDGFGVESATMLQRCVARIYDGKPLNDLLDRGTERERKEVEAAVGCDPYHLPAVLRPEIQFDAPVRSGKTLLDVAAMVCRTQTVDVSPVKPGEEPPRSSVLSTQTDTARTALGHLNVATASRVLKHLIIGQDSDSVTFRHPSGLPIPIKVIAAQHGGYSLASRWSAGVSFQEAPGWYGTGKVIALADQRDTALGRLLGGAQIYASGSPWQASELCFKRYSENWGTPTDDLIVIHPQTVDGVTPAEQLNPYYWTKERVERMRRTAPRTYRMHVLNQYGAGTACFDFDAVERAFRPIKQELQPLSRPFMVLDPSSGKKDSFTYAVVQRMQPVVPFDAYAHQVHLNSDGSYGWRTPSPGGKGYDYFDGMPPLKEDVTVETRPFWWFKWISGFEGSFWDQLPADQLMAEIASVAHLAEVRTAFTDQREFYSLSALARQFGLRLEERPFTGGSKERAVALVRRWLASGEVIFAPHPKLKAELHNFTEKPTPGGGFTFGARGSNHDDYAVLPLICALATTDPYHQRTQYAA